MTVVCFASIFDGSQIIRVFFIAHWHLRMYCDTKTEKEQYTFQVNRMPKQEKCTMQFKNSVCSWDSEEYVPVRPIFVETICTGWAWSQVGGRYMGRKYVKTYAWLWLDLMGNIVTLCFCLFKLLQHMTCGYFFGTKEWTLSKSVILSI